MATKTSKKTTASKSKTLAKKPVSKKTTRGKSA